MSTISTMAQRDDPAGSILQPLGHFLQRWWIAYITWRIERSAIAHLMSMSDRGLKDIGLIRSDIHRRVKSQDAAQRI